MYLPNNTASHPRIRQYLRIPPPEPQISEKDIWKKNTLPHSKYCPDKVLKETALSKLSLIFSFVKIYFGFLFFAYITRQWQANFGRNTAETSSEPAGRMTGKYPEIYHDRLLPHSYLLTILEHPPPSSSDDREFKLAKLSLANSMQWSHSWEFSTSSASQAIPHILLNPKVHYHIHKSPQKTVPLKTQKRIN